MDSSCVRIIEAALLLHGFFNFGNSVPWRRSDQRIWSNDRWGIQDKTQDQNNIGTVGFKSNQVKQHVTALYGLSYAFVVVCCFVGFETDDYLQQWRWNRWKVQRNQWNPDVHYRLQNDLLPPGHRRKPGYYPEISPEELGEKFEGDMVVHPKTRKKRGVLSDRFQRWPIGLIHYKLDDQYTADQKALILEAMDEITAKTVVKGSRCIYFAPRTNQDDFLDIKPDIGCYSSVGKIGGAQTVSLEPDCIYKGTIMHEMLHAVGLWHEQSRQDRDDYVTVNYANILEEDQNNIGTVGFKSNQVKQHVTALYGLSYAFVVVCCFVGFETDDPVVNRSVNFLKYTVDYIDDLGLPYDYDSIMHYGFAFFAKDPYSPTLSPKYPYAFIGQRRYMSPIDVKKVQLLYGCGGRTRWDCDFENGGTCDWNQDKGDDFDWEIHRGSTATAFTGPSGDNTNGLGYYLYAEADGHSQQICRLSSPTLPPNYYCIQLHYHMAGYTVGTLQLQAQSIMTDDRDILIEKKGHQGDNWKHGQFEYQARASFKLVLMAEIGTDSYGDIAVDDISIEPGFCENERNFRGTNLL